MSDRPGNLIQLVAYWLVVALSLFDYGWRLIVQIQSRFASWPSIILLSVFIAIWLFLATACLWGNRFAAAFLCAIGLFVFLGSVLFMVVTTSYDHWFWVASVALTSLAYFVLGFMTLKRSKSA